MPVRVARTLAKFAARLYRRSAVALNLTLNNDTNARIFEVLGAGGTLVTDRLERQGGLEALFVEGVHYAAYDGDAELVEVVSRLLADPVRAMEMARLGHEAFLARHLPEHRVQEYWDHVDGRSDALVRNLDYEPRVAAARRAGPVPLDVLVERMRAYEFLQEQVRVRSGVRVLYSAGVEPLTVADSADLSRLHRAYACFPDQAPEAWQRLRALGVAEQVASTRVEAAVEEDWDLIVIGMDEFLDPHVVNLLARVNSGRVAIAGNGKPVPPSRRLLLAQLGWLPDPEWPSLHRRAPAAQVVGEVAIAPTPGRPLAIAARPPVDDATAPGRTEDTGGSPSEASGPEGALAHAHATVAAFDWDAVAASLPASMNALVSTGLVGSLRAGRPIDGAGRPLPGLVYAATDFVEPRLREDWRVHLWGSGADIAWWAARVSHVTATLASGGYDPAHLDGHEREREGVRVEDPEGPAYADIPDTGRPIDLVVVGGESPERCVHALLGTMDPHGLVVVENSDRAACAEAVRLLGDAGWRRIDFWGILPQYLFRGCTSVFFKDDRYVVPGATPDAHDSSLGPSFAQITGQ